MDQIPRLTTATAWQSPQKKDEWFFAYGRNLPSHLRSENNMSKLLRSRSEAIASLSLAKVRRRRTATYPLRGVKIFLLNLKVISRVRDRWGFKAQPRSSRVDSESRAAPPDLWILDWPLSSRWGEKRRRARAYKHTVMLLSRAPSRGPHSVHSPTGQTTHTLISMSVPSSWHKSTSKNIKYICEKY